MTFVRSKNISLKYQRFTTLGSEYRDWKIEFAVELKKLVELCFLRDAAGFFKITLKRS